MILQQNKKTNDTDKTSKGLSKNRGREELEFKPHSSHPNIHTHSSRTREFKTTPKDKGSGEPTLIHNLQNSTLTIRHAINESERFIKFLDKRFNLSLKGLLVVTINPTKKTTLGYFKPQEHNQAYSTEESPLNSINLNPIHLKTSNPYEILAHELAHFINHERGIKDCSKSGRHNKKFKTTAEGLFLKVEKCEKRGFSTTETEEFNKMVKLEFKPQEFAFEIFQKYEEGEKAKTKMKKWSCDCCVVRCATDLNATCLNCNKRFKKEE